MKKRLVIRLFRLFILIILISLAAKFFLELWLEKKIETALNSGNDYKVVIKQTDIDILRSFIELKRVRINPDEDKKEYSGLIGSVKLTGISFVKAFLKRDLNVKEILISKSNFKVNFPLKGKQLSPVISPLNMAVGRILISQFNLEMKNDAGGQEIFLTNASVRINGFHVSKMDTISPHIIKLSNFRAGEFKLVSSDRLYSYKLKEISYSPDENLLSADSFLVLPKYKNTDFTARLKYQRSCFSAGFSKIRVHDFYIDSFLKPQTIRSSHVNLGEMTLNVFRDNRKEFLHKRKPTLQELINSIPVRVKLDTISLSKGKLAYTSHAEKAKEPVTFIINDIHAGILNLTNDNSFKAKSGNLEIKANGRLMGKSKFSFELRGNLFDRNNTMSVDGSLQQLDMNDLNPILEKSASVFVSGKVEEMNFSFVADNSRAEGKLTMLYYGLQLTFRDKRSGDTTSLRSRIQTIIAKMKILDANPFKGDKIRIGIIDYERDPERFLVHYCFSSILTGVSSTLVKEEKKGKRLIILKF